MISALLALAALATEPLEVADPPQRKWAAVAAPLVAFDTSMGVGGGAYGQIVLADLEGDRPYRLSLDAQGYTTTGGWNDHYVGWDAPGLFGSRVRWDARFRYQSWSRAPYYGMGNDTPRPEPDAVPVNWNRWKLVRPFVFTHLRVPLEDGPWELYIGLLGSVLTVDAFPNSQLAEERPLGVDGGAIGTLTAGTFRDTRTDEVDPTDGTALDLAARTALPAPLSSYTWAGWHASLRGWWSLTPGLVLAGHGVVDGNVGEVPFFEAAIFGGLQRTGIGGRYLLRGLPEERLRGDGLVATQWELRARLGEVSLFDRLDVRFTAAPFFDAGQVFRWEDRAAFDPHGALGAGLRLTLNGLLVLRFDGAMGVERWQEDPSRRTSPQLYMLAAQPF